MRDLLKRKFVRTDRGSSVVELLNLGTTYVVTVDGAVYYKSPNNLFAVQRYNEI